MREVLAALTLIESRLRSALAHVERATTNASVAAQTGLTPTLSASIAIEAHAVVDDCSGAVRMVSESMSGLTKAVNAAAREASKDSAP